MLPSRGMARHLVLLLAAAPLLAAAQGINSTEVFAFYTLATSGPPAKYGNELYSWCPLGPPYCDMACDGFEYCATLAGTYCAERVVLSGNASACIACRYNKDLNEGTWFATDASDLPQVSVTTHGDYLYFSRRFKILTSPARVAHARVKDLFRPDRYWADVVYDGSVGPFVDPTVRRGFYLPGAALVPAPPPAPISNETVHAFYELAGSGTPWNLTGGVHRTFCADGTCDEACDGSSADCAASAAAWCNTPASPCVVVYYNAKQNGGKATAADAHGLPPTNMTTGDWRFWIDVPHRADVGPPPSF